jgi:MoxR-like ATPase
MNHTFETIRTEAKAAFPERSTVIDGMIASIVARKHALLIGPPGTAKSAMARYLAKAFGSSYFEWLLTKFSTPDEIFGPISLKALEQDRFSRVVAGKLPEAEIAFLDEIFKSNSAILNSILTLANERVFHNDGVAVQCPLVTMFGASNELPEGKELEALFDRFLLRFQVEYLIRPSNFRSIVTASDPDQPSVYLTAQELSEAQTDAAQVQVGADTVEALLTIRDQLKAEGIVASDRRWKHSLQLVQASAYLDGGTETCPEDLQILADVLWREPKDRPLITKILGKVADPAAAQAMEIVDAHRELVTKLQTKSSGPKEAYSAECARTMAQAKDQLKALRKLKLKAGRRATKNITEAEQEIAGQQQELMRIITDSMCLPSQD